MSIESDGIVYDANCERFVLGTILSKRDMLDKVREYISEDCFYLQKHKEIFKAIMNIVNRGDEADIVTILPELKKNKSKITPFELTKIASDFTYDIEQYTLHLVELKKRRQIYYLGLVLQQSGSNESKDITEIISNATDEINSILGDSISHIKSIGDYLPKIYERVNDNLAGKIPEYTCTGFSKIDQHCTFQPNSLIIIAGDSSQGKTSLALSIAINAAKDKKKIAVYSMEMTSIQLITRLTAMDSNINCGTLYNGKLDSNELSIFDTTINKLSKLGIYFDDRSTSNIDTILSSIRSMAIKHNIDGVIVDFLQIISVDSRSNTETQLAEISRKLKNIAKELNIWVMLISQLNRNLDDPEPVLSRLRGSGQINEAADATCLIYRPQYYNETYNKNYHYSGRYANNEVNNTALINFAKCRNSATYSFLAGFNPATNLFYDLDKPPELPFEFRATDDEQF